MSIRSEFVVVSRVPSAFIVRQEDRPFVLENFPVFGHPVRVEFYTRYDDEEYNLPVPRELVIEVRGPTDSLEDAVTLFTEIANSILGPLTLSANAPIGEATLYVAFDNTPGKLERDFWQNLIEDERGLPQTSRYLRVDATISLMLAVLASRGQKRIIRAGEQYRLALKYWQPGWEKLAVAHLFMGMEALKEVALERELETNSMEQLADRWSVERRNSTGNVRRGGLQAAALRQILFRGDKECHSKAKQMSDGFEHGFEGLLLLHELAQEVRDSTAGYLRAAIIDLSGVPLEAAQTLLTPPLNEPESRWKFSHRISGRIVGDSDQVTGDTGSPYPHFIANNAFNLRAAEDGGYEISVNLTPSIGHGLVLQPYSFEDSGLPA